MKIQEFLEAIGYRIVGAEEYCWKCYGPNARFLDFREDEVFATAIFDTTTQQVFEISTGNERLNSAYRWIDPAYVDAHDQECHDRDVYENQAWDEVDFIALPLRDILVAVSLTVNGYDYNRDSTASVEQKVSPVASDDSAPVEFERRWLVDRSCIDLIQEIADYHEVISQGYVCADDKSVVRLRSVVDKDDYQSWFVTVKKDTGIPGKNYEFEYELGDDASLLFDSLDRKLEKIRYTINRGYYTYQVDEFHSFDGKLIVEVEFDNDAASVDFNDSIPSWFGEEITGRKEYSNYQLCKNGWPK